MRVLFFAHLQDATGQAEMELAPSRPVTAGELWRILLDRHPELEKHRSSVRLARNGEYAGADERFQAGDEVALIPPVSGG